MKRTLALTLALTTSLSAIAGENFGGIELDASLPTSQVRTLKEDFSYLYSNPVKSIDSEFQSMAGLSKVDGPHMYNWIFNRVKYIIGESYQLRGRNIVKQAGHVFPATPLPPSLLDNTNQYARIMIMSNVGASLYVMGKKEKKLTGIKLGGKTVFAPSPRVGIVQVGEGLFLERLLINKEPSSEANKIKRLGTIFHEARHGDGHSEHTGFIHNPCPPGHALSGFDACEASANGAYTLEAVATKTLLANCRTCSNEDKTKLEASIADGFSRVVLRSHLKTEKQILEEIATYQGVIEFYVGYLAQNPSGSEVFVKELERLRAQVKQCEEQLKELRTPMTAQKLDPKPEGTFKEVLVEESSRLMNQSLKR